ncbi:MAG: SDR family NAD(P)-dependent oxidoreductase [Saccharofermentanales bacterium]
MNTHPKFALSVSLIGIYVLILERQVWNMFSLRNKVFIVTGAGSGLGRELAVKLTGRGAKVAACDINEKTLEETRSMVSDPELIKPYFLDVTDSARVNAFPGIVKAHYKSLSGVINNAGIIQPFVKFSELPESEVRRVFDINFFGLVDMTRSALREMDRNQDGFIVNISSMGGFLPVPGQGVYGASKAAVKLFTEALYAEMKGSNIHVSVVFPGAMATNIAANSLGGEAMQASSGKTAVPIKSTTPDVAANIIINSIERGKFKIFVGKDSNMMQKVYRLMPVTSIDIMAKKIRKMTAG